MAQKKKETRQHVGDLLIYVELRLGGRSKANNMARSVEVVALTINGQPFRLPGEHRANTRQYHTATVAPKYVPPSMKALSDMIPARKHAYSTVPPRS